MKYCLNVTKSHQSIGLYPDCLECIHALLNNEGCDVSPSPFFGKGIEVINGDVLEEKVKLAAGLGLSAKDKSMDIIFGVKNRINSSESYQLIELKLKSKNFYFLDKASLSSIKFKGNDNFPNDEAA